MRKRTGMIDKEGALEDEKMCLGILHLDKKDKKE